jgi:hypothetical protein
MIFFDGIELFIPKLKEEMSRVLLFYFNYFVGLRGGYFWPQKKDGGFSVVCSFLIIYILWYV